MHSIKGLIFDLDGVVVDTAKYHYFAWKKVADELNINFTEKDNEKLKGVSRVRSMEIILEIGGLTLEENAFKDICDKKNKIYLEYINQLEEKEILPGVRTFLEDARKKGYKIALGSASKNAVKILERLNIIDLFDVIIDGTKVVYPKPNPEVFLKGADAMKLSNHECIVFEDAKSGIKAANDAGMISVGIGDEKVLGEANINIQGFSNMLIDKLCQRITFVL